MSGGGPMFTGDYASKPPESEGWYPLTKRVISSDAYRGDGGGDEAECSALIPGNTTGWIHGRVLCECTAVYDTKCVSNTMQQHLHKK